MKSTNKGLDQAVSASRPHERTIAYAGSFDPLTKGHLNLIERALKLCDKLVVVVIDNAAKTQHLPREERRRLVTKAVEQFAQVEVCDWDGLFTDFCKKEDIEVCLRGLRDAADLEAEKQMSRINKELNENLETVFLITAPEYDSLSSSAVRELAAYGVALDPYVPASICQEIEKLYSV